MCFEWPFKVIQGRQSEGTLILGLTTLRIVDLQHQKISMGTPFRTAPTEILTRRRPSTDVALGGLERAQRVTHFFSSLLRATDADVGGRRATSVLAPERHSDSSRLSSSLIKRLTRLKWRRIEMKTDRWTGVTGVLHTVQTHRI